MTGRAFIDTNVLVYVYDGRTPGKQDEASELMQLLADEQTACVISTQVLQEIYAALTGNLGFEGVQALTMVQKMERSGFRVETVNVPTIWRAARRSMDDKLSFWDGLIVETAIAAQCTRLYTEDLQHGRSFGSLTVVNPFI
jgi:predicted nucleic acid-binding protein